MSIRSGMGADGKDAAAAPLSRQSSIYSLTFDEFQSTRGGIRKEFGSMNMDEFLKNIWTAEESQAMAAALGAASATDETAGLQRQGSLTLSRTLSQKTVDEVWRDLKRENAGDCGGSDLPQQQRQQTLGEMTLEEFLVRAGVLREEINSSIGAAAGDFSNNSGSVFYGDLSVAGNTSAVGVGYSHADRGDVGIIPAGAVLTSFAGHLPVTGNVDLGSQPAVRGSGLAGIGDPAVSNEMMPGMVGFGAGGVAIATAGSPANQINSDGLTKGNGELSPLSPVPYMFSGGLRGKKCNGVERRQRRMIKNRESAARSRARKQAYTLELEAEVAKLKEHNQELQRHQAEIMEKQKNEVLELLADRQCEPKKLCLRRTQTSPWNLEAIRGDFVGIWRQLSEAQGAIGLSNLKEEKIQFLYPV